MLNKDYYVWLLRNAMKNEDDENFSVYLLLFLLNVEEETLEYLYDAWTK